jgi:hypothetical protein
MLYHVRKRENRFSSIVVARSLLPPPPPLAGDKNSFVVDWCSSLFLPPLLLLLPPLLINTLENTCTNKHDPPATTNRQCSGKSRANVSNVDGVSLSTYSIASFSYEEEEEDKGISFPLRKKLMSLYNTNTNTYYTTPHCPTGPEAGVVLAKQQQAISGQRFTARQFGRAQAD